MSVAMYVRVSTEEQVHGFSIDVQKDRLEAYCKSQGWDSPNLYIDDGYTGTNMNRPALKRLIRHVEAGKLEAVIVYKLDRLGRKQKDVLHLLEDVFEKNNVAFKSATEPFDTSTPLGKAMLGILAVFAQLERDMIIERTTSGRRERVNQGMWPGGPIPFGYGWNKELKQLYIKPDEARIVREIFKRYLQGQSRLAISEWAADITKARKFDHTIIRDMLSRPLYAGKLINVGSIVEGNHEAIIDEHTWHAVQSEVMKRKDGAPPVGEYLLTGLLTCGVCGGNIVHVKRKTSRGDKFYLYELYACKKQHVRKKDSGGERCDLGYYRREAVEGFVVKQIREASLKPQKIKELIQKKRAAEPDSEVRKTLLSKLENITAGIENLYDAIQVGAIKASAVGDRLKRLEEDRESIHKQLDELEDTPNYKDHREFQFLIKEINQAWDYLTLDEQKQMIRRLFKEVVLSKDGDHEVVWNVVD